MDTTAPSLATRYDSLHTAHMLNWARRRELEATPVRSQADEGELMVIERLTVRQEEELEALRKPRHDLRYPSVHFSRPYRSVKGEGGRPSQIL
jgi:hypothetical protein